MRYWTEFKTYKPKIRGKKIKYDNTIFSFDIETSNYLIYNNTVINASEYDKMINEIQENSIKQSNMYIWSFGIDNEIYYGRTWSEFKEFLQKIDDICSYKKYIFIHNFAFEFQFMKNVFNFKNVFARVSHKVIKAELEDYNFEIHCTYFMSNCSLNQLAKVYNLKTKKLVGDLDYDKIRNTKTLLTAEELQYCENDCLIIYEYIKKELETYTSVKYIPCTSTGKVRRELKEKTRKDVIYKRKVRNAVNIDPHIYNMMIKCFAGRLYTRKLLIYR